MLRKGTILQVNLLEAIDGDYSDYTLVKKFGQKIVNTLKEMNTNWFSSDEEIHIRKYVKQLGPTKASLVGPIFDIPSHNQANEYLPHDAVNEYATDEEDHGIDTNEEDEDVNKPRSHLKAIQMAKEKQDSENQVAQFYERGDSEGLSTFYAAANRKRYLEESAKEREAKTRENQSKMVVQFYGKTQTGESVSLLVTDFRPFFYVKVSELFLQTTTVTYDGLGKRPICHLTTLRMAFEKTLATVRSARMRERNKSTGNNSMRDIQVPKQLFESDILAMRFVRFRKLHGFDNERRHLFIKVKVRSLDAFRILTRAFYTTDKHTQEWRLNPEGFKVGNHSVRLYESEIPPLFRMMHVNNMSPSGWVELNVDMKTVVPVEPSHVGAVCNHFLIVSRGRVLRSLPEKTDIVPYIKMSFDIESSSSHGDFPVPIKTYKRFVMQVVELFQKSKMFVAAGASKWYDAFFEALCKAFSLPTRKMVGLSLDTIDKVFPKVPVQNRSELAERYTRWVFESVRFLPYLIDGDCSSMYLDKGQEPTSGSLEKTLARRELWKVRVSDAKRCEDLEQRVMGILDAEKGGVGDSDGEDDEVEDVPDQGGHGALDVEDEVDGAVVSGCEEDGNTCISNAKEPSSRNTNGLDLDLADMTLPLSYNLLSATFGDQIDVARYFEDEKMDSSLRVQHLTLLMGASMVTEYWFRGESTGIDNGIPYLIDSKTGRCKAEDYNKPPLYFPELEGDRVTFIGSTFRRNGEQHSFLNHCFSVNPCDPVEGCVIQHSGTEAKMLVDWANFVRKQDPDIILGYNTSNFDWSFLFMRAKELGCLNQFLLLSRARNEVCARWLRPECPSDWNVKWEMQMVRKEVQLAAGFFELHTLPIRGRVEVDMLIYFRRNGRKFSSYKLDDISNETIGGAIVYMEHYQHKKNPAEKCTLMVTNNLVGLSKNNCVHVEIESYNTDSYRNGAKFDVLEVQSSPKWLLVKDWILGETIVSEDQMVGLNTCSATFLDTLEMRSIKDPVTGELLADDGYLPELHKLHSAKPAQLETPLMDGPLAENWSFVRRGRGSLRMRWGLAKDDVTPFQLFELAKGTPTDLAVVAKYCVQDCNLVQNLFDKEDALLGYSETAKLCGVPVAMLVSRGQSVKLVSLLSEQCRNRGILVATIDRTRNVQVVEGAIVLTPKCKLYILSVSVGDYASLYPNCMRSCNLCLSTKVWTKLYGLDNVLVRDATEEELAYDNLPGHSYVYKIFPYFEYEYPAKRSAKTKMIKVLKGYKVSRFIQTVPGVIPSVVTELIKKRTEIRGRIKKEQDDYRKKVLDNQQLGMKETANSSYGALGATVSIFYEPDVANSITSSGRSNLQYARELLETCYNQIDFELPEFGKFYMELEYIYGDTDSVFFQTTFWQIDAVTGIRETTPIDGDRAHNMSVVLAKIATATCTKFLKAPHDFEYEKTLEPLILLNPKKYLAMKDGERVQMGVVTKRRDNAPILKDIYGGSIDIIMKQKNIMTAVEFMRGEIKRMVTSNDASNGGVPLEKLIITKSLRGFYTDPLAVAHKVLADRIAFREPGNKPMAGDRIGYVVIHPSEEVVQREMAKLTGNRRKIKILLGERVETPAYLRLHPEAEIDYFYYISNQLLKPLCQLFSMVIEELLDRMCHWEAQVAAATTAALLDDDVTTTPPPLTLVQIQEARLFSELREVKRMPSIKVAFSATGILTEMRSKMVDIYRSTDLEPIKIQKALAKERERVTRLVLFSDLEHYANTNNSRFVEKASSADKRVSNTRTKNSGLDGTANGRKNRNNNRVPANFTEKNVNAQQANEELHAALTKRLVGNSMHNYYTAVVELQPIANGDNKALTDKYRDTLTDSFEMRNRTPKKRALTSKQKDSKETNQTKPTKPTKRQKTIAETMFVTNLQNVT